MPIPDYQAIMLPLLQFAGDGKEHSLTEAEFAKAILESHDIEAIVQAGDCAGAVTNCDLQVMASSEARAKELLETPNGYDVSVQPEPIGTAEGRKRPVPGVVIFLMGLLMGGLVGAVAVYSHNEKRSHYTGTYTKDNDGDGRFDEEETYTPFGLVEKTAKIP